jgi:hypothetical protein
MVIENIVAENNATETGLNGVSEKENIKIKSMLLKAFNPENVPIPKIEYEDPSYFSSTQVCELYDIVHTNEGAVFMARVKALFKSFAERKNLLRNLRS